MSSSKHEPTVADLDKPYEQNVIGFGGIVKFAIGLFLLIVITFILMWLLNNVLEENNKESKAANNPMAMSELEKLPPEPRLQTAPGFGVDSPNGRVKMELGAPQAEYRELKQQWDEIREHGMKDSKTGVLTAMPIEEAVSKVLESNLKAKTGEEAEHFATESRKYISDASSGRKATATRR
ncbi:MAG: hypothetical protein ACJ72Z_02585 [Pyrinomonadaceae bacterium]